MILITLEARINEFIEFKHSYKKYAFIHINEKIFRKYLGKYLFISPNSGI